MRQIRRVPCLPAMASPLCDGIREFATASGHTAWPFSALAMPIYEYQCPACQKVFEEWTTVSEAHEDKPCPTCGAASPRVLSNTSFVLKGAGWYVSDYGYRKGVKDEDSSTAYGASGAMTPPADTAFACRPRPPRPGIPPPRRIPPARPQLPARRPPPPKREARHD